MFFNRLKLAFWGTGETIKQKVKEAQKSMDNFFSRTRLGGLINYRDTDFQEVEHLRSLYLSEIAEDDEVGHEYALDLFAVDYEEKVPKASEHEINSAFRFHKRKNDGDLAGEMSLISDILVYTANLRLKVNLVEHINSSAFLFCAEFAKWVNDSAKVTISEEFKLSIQTRLRYLSYIQEEKVFQKEPNDETSMYLLVYNLSQILEYAILPKVEMILSRQSIRDHLRTLQKHSDRFFSEVTKGLFYLFTEEENFEYNVFHLEYLDIYKVPKLSKIIDETELGDLFSSLKTQLQKAREGDLPMKETCNYFLTEEGEVNTDLRLKLVSIHEVTNTKSRGIHELMRRQYTPMHLLLLTFGHLSDYTCFMSALKQAYDLSGDGGNLMMYIALGTETSNFLSYFNALKSQLKTSLNQLLELSDKVYQQLIEKLEFDNPWNRNYCRSKRLIKDALEYLDNAGAVVNQIGQQLSYVNSENYLNETKGRMDDFRYTLSSLGARLNIQLSTPQVSEIEDYTLNKLAYIYSSDSSSDDELKVDQENKRNAPKSEPIGRKKHLNSKSNQFFQLKGKDQEDKSTENFEHSISLSSDDK